jgi:[ribosomal protein S5]-alanine N-acetyltransferase
MPSPVFLHTNRLILRPLGIDDVSNLFALDSNPEVMRFLGNHPIESIEQVYIYLENIMQQYTQNGIGRWAVIEKESDLFVGWAGLKFNAAPINGQNFIYDMGYRLKPEFWGKGYATECTVAWIEYAKDYLNLKELYSITHVENVASQNVLQKCGFIKKNNFSDIIYEESIDCIWFELKW